MSYIVDDLREEIDRLQKRVAELESNDQRYQWLRHAYSAWSALFCDAKYYDGLWVRLGSRYVGEAFDKKIDELLGLEAK